MLTNILLENNSFLNTNQSNFYPKETREESILINGHTIKKIINEFWTSQQRQAHSLHEISYRACFKPQLPRFFIQRFTKENDIVYDPFTGRGTTIIEAALLNRNIISNDINPISKIFCRGRLHIPHVFELKERLFSIPIYKNILPDRDLSMFYHTETMKEILSLKHSIQERIINAKADALDFWIQMVATNRLTGHSKGFFSVYTLPPNQAVSPKRQLKINEQKNQIPEYRNTKEIIFKKSKQLLRDITTPQIQILKNKAEASLFLTKDASDTPEIPNESIQLTVTSPPFLDVVQYTDDNWLRCWFNDIDTEEIAKHITITKKLSDWIIIMTKVFKELYRITKQEGYVAFEVGEVRNGTIKLDEHIVDIGIKAGFICLGILINEQVFTKTSNIWGVDNNNKGTNSNRIVILKK